MCIFIFICACFRGNRFVDIINKIKTQLLLVKYGIFNQSLLGVVYCKK